MKNRITEYYPNLTDDALEKLGGGFTVLACNEEMARKEILLSIDADDFTEVEISGYWDLDDYETIDKLERQTYK